MYRRAYFGAVGRDCRSICRRTFDISGFPVRKLIHRREETSGRIGIGCSACVARTGTHEFRIRFRYVGINYAVYLRGTPQVRIRDTSHRHISPAVWPGRGMIFRPSALPEDSLTGVLYEAFRTDRLGRNVRRGAVSYRSGGGFPVLRSDGCSDSLLSEVRTEQVVIRIGSGARDHLRKRRSISRRASFSLRYSRLS